MRYKLTVCKFRPKESFSKVTTSDPAPSSALPDPDGEEDQGKRDAGNTPNCGCVNKSSAAQSPGSQHRVVLARAVGSTIDSKATLQPPTQTKCSVCLPLINSHNISPRVALDARD